jgi:hypothetical protein
MGASGRLTGMATTSRSRRGVLAVIGALAAMTLAAPTAGAAEARYPDPAPPTQITRDLTLREAAQRGLVTLTGKGGPEAQGDQVSLKLRHRKVRGPVTVTVRVELTTTPRVTPKNREGVRRKLPRLQQRLQAELNRGSYKTRQGDPIRFHLDFQFRSPDSGPRPGYHQVVIVDPRLDLNPPEPDFRSEVEDLGIPNRLGAVQNGRWTTGDFAKIPVLAHETLHLAGLDDRYGDFYRVGRRQYPLPTVGMNPQELRDFARNHKPPLPAPPAGRVVSNATPGTSRCDVMGTGEHLACRRISRRDLDWFDSHAGVRVVAEPGELLLNKDDSRQNWGIGFRTIVFAAPGETTTADGISGYCIDQPLGLPGTATFDALGPAREVPGREPLAQLLELSGTLQTSVDEPVLGMLYAVWDVTNGVDLDETTEPAEARAVLAQAGVPENSVPGGLPHLTDPNAGSPDTAAVSTTDVLPDLPSSPAKPVPVTINFAGLYPNRVRPGRRVRSDLLVSSVGDVELAQFRVERRVGRRWRRVRVLRPRPISPGHAVLPLNFGRLRPGKHRLVVSVGRLTAAQVTRRVSFRVRG